MFQSEPTGSVHGKAFVCGPLPSSTKNETKAVKVTRCKVRRKAVRVYELVDWRTRPGYRGDKSESPVGRGPSGRLIVLTAAIWLKDVITQRSRGDCTRLPPKRIQRMIQSLIQHLTTGTVRVSLAHHHQTTLPDVNWITKIGHRHPFGSSFLPILEGRGAREEIKPTTSCLPVLHTYSMIAGHRECHLR